MPRLAAAAALGVALAGAAALAAAAPHLAGLAGPLAFPRPSPQLRRDTPTSYGLLVRNRTCEHCHAEIAAEWRTSRHAAAHENRAYKESLAREAPAIRSFCEGCHAPEGERGGHVDAATEALGVSCLTCHVPLGPVLAAPRALGGPPAGRPPHAVLRTPRFASSEACATCHEFGFPAQRGAEPLLMQSTVSEHLASPDAARDGSCARCHMPLVGGAEGGPRPHRSHRFRGGYDADFVRHSLQISASRAGGAASISLVPVGVTHAVPTGDLFRRLELEAVVRGADGAALARERRFLSRHFERLRGGGMRLTSDDRPSGAGRTETLELGAAARGRPIDVRVLYQRVELQRGDDEAGAVVGGELELASFRLEPTLQP